MDKRITISVTIDGMTLSEAEELEERIRELTEDFSRKRITVSSREIRGTRLPLEDR